MSETVLVIGAGSANGVGGALARRFAQENYDVVIAGRTQAKVDATAEEINQLGGKAIGMRVDVTSSEDQDVLFEFVESLKKPIASVIFNAGSNLPIGFADLSEQQFEEYWRIGCMGGFITAKRALPILAEQGSGSMLFTGASASLRGKPNFGHFASSKAALRNLAQALAREYGPQGVHVAHVVIDGVVNGDIVNTRFKGYIESLGDDGALDPNAIAETFWQLHNQPRSTWTHEVDLRPFKENW